MPSHLKTEAVVLAKLQGLSKDSFVTLFTKEKGKVVAIAKGVKSIRSRRLSSLMTGNLVKVVLWERAERYYLQEATIISIFSQIKKDETLLNSLYFFLFILNALLPQGQREEAIYNLLMKFLIELSRGAFTGEKMMFYCRKLLHYFGYGEEVSTMSELVKKIEAIIGKKIPIFII